jgi:hypothetical protein
VGQAGRAEPLACGVYVHSEQLVFESNWTVGPQMMSELVAVRKLKSKKTWLLMWTKTYIFGILVLWVQTSWTTFLL